ncbi:MAG: hypothetical protein EA426_12035 [Spirochaetaceae bacterium]|nr:MAG: hypothetical protein EA426_12035 [Spirochaetaceae bacterium]
MILLVRRHRITLLVLVALGFALGMSLFAYLSLRGFDGLSELEQKALAERILLVGIVGTLAVFGVLSIVLYDAVKLNAVFKRLAGMHRMSVDQIQMELRGLGTVGEQIGRLYSSINSLSARKSTRISGLNALLTTVVRRSEANMIVVNAGGKVYQATPAALAQFELSHAEIAERPVDELIELERFTETAAAVSRGKGSHRIGENRDPVVVLPVTNDQGLVAYYVYLLGDDAREELKRNPIEPRESREPEKKQSAEPENKDDAKNLADTTGGEKRRGKRANAASILFARLSRKSRDR